MPQDYRQVVFDAYKKKKEEMDLSSNLLDPTPGNLRAECLIVHREKYSPKDHEVLRLFFSDGDKEKGYLKSIENSPAEKFKQMSKILKGVEVKNPGIKYFELLEWLMSLNLGTSTFYYRNFYNPPQSKKEETIEKIVETDHNENGSSSTAEHLKDVVDDDNKEDYPKEKMEDEVPVQELPPASTNTPQPPPENKEEIINLPKPLMSTPTVTVEKPKAKLKVKNMIALAVLFAIATGGSYAFLEHINKQCMYWTGNEYQSVGCSIKVDQATVIALDKEKLINLKKINRLDTITEKDLGKVWYVKIKQDSAEFYTDSGTYPLNPKKRLMPMTPYILNKYILRQTQ